MAFWRRDNEPSSSDNVSSKGTDYTELLASAQADQTKIEIPELQGNPEGQSIINEFAEAGQDLIVLMAELRGNITARDTAERASKALAQIAAEMPSADTTRGALETGAKLAKELVTAMGRAIKDGQGRVVHEGYVPEKGYAVFSEDNQSSGVEGDQKRWGLNTAVRLVQSLTGERKEVDAKPSNMTLGGAIEWDSLDPKRPTSREVPLGLDTALVMRAVRSGDEFKREDIIAGEVISTLPDDERERQRERARALNAPSEPPEVF